MTKKQYFSRILILGLLTAIGPFSVDMYLPGFDDIAHNLHTSVARVSLSLSSFFIGISAGQLLYGPLLDRYGRKKPLYAGLLLYIGSSAACIWAKSIDALIVLRLIQAVGACSATVASMAMARDLFGGKEIARVFSLLLLVLGASPMIAPTVGGYVVTLFGWRAVFVILLIMAILITLLTVFGLPESRKADKGFSLKPGPIIKNFLAVCSNPQFLTFSLSGSFAFAGLLAYVAGSPGVFMDLYHVDKKVYGWIFALLSVSFIGLSQFNRLLLRRYSSEQIIWMALTGQVIIAAVLLGGNLAGWFGMPHIIALLFLFLGCVGYTFPNAMALSLAPFEQNAGTASALMGAFQLGIGSVASMLESFFSNGTANPMLITIAITSLLALFILIAGRKLGKPTLV